MRWFEGGIAEAVQTSKAKNAVFVVFVEGKDDASKKTAITLDNEAVSLKLESEDFIAIKLESESESYGQFVQIYKLVPVPSLFFIGGNGVPLEVVAGETEVPELLSKISTVLEKSGKLEKQDDRSKPSSSQETKTESQEVTPVKTDDIVSEGASSSKNLNETEAVEETELPVNVEASPSTMSKDEKVERAKELIDKKRKIKEEEEEQTKRLKEIERRKMGQEVQKLRKWQQDQELKQLKEDRMREKAEEAAARERILQQIAQDRAERASRFSATQEEAKKQVEDETKRRAEQLAMDGATRSSVARIQFRLPDGSAHTNNFDADATLSEVRTYAATQLNFPFRDFTMSTVFPRREFTDNDSDQTVRDLQLLPTAVILILPTSTSAGVTSSSQSYGVMVSQMMWSVLTPFFTLLNYIRSFVFGGGGAGASSSGSSNTRYNNRDRTTSTNSSRTQSSTGARRRIPNAETTTVRRQGNVHRLTNHRDSSDDENNTWNGNSTQQM